LLSDFLRCTGLDSFVASSYGALHAFGLCLEERLAAFADAERSLLAQGMLDRLIAVIADENFHGPNPCLVAIEPVSDFILVEEYQPQRDAQTWVDAIGRGIAGLAVRIALLTSDQARGLIACASKHLHAQHLPELFHGQRDLARPLLGPLHRQIASAGKTAQEATQSAQHWRDEQQRALQEPRRRGRATDYTWRIEVTEALEKWATGQLQACVARKEQARQALRGLADDYHPFDPQTGKPVTAEQIEEHLGRHLSVAEEVANAAGLGAKATAALEQGRKWLLTLVASMAWFWGVARQRVQALQLSAEAEQQVYERLLPGLYWEQASRRGRTAEERKRKQALGERLQQEAWSSEALASLGESTRQEVERVGKEVVGLFQRSSSCVEGRNGRLALFQHGHTRLSEGKLKALTAVHNYVSRRQDGTTAAERFFGKKQRDALGWLLEQMPDLPRPAAKRPSTVRQQAQQVA
jgi:hypothetical protein